MTELSLLAIVTITIGNIEITTLEPVDCVEETLRWEESGVPFDAVCRYTRAPKRSPKPEPRP